MSGRDRRDFLKALAAGAVAVGMSPWAFARPIAAEQAPAQPLHDPRYREWSAVALGEAKRLGCTYADIRFTRNRSQSISLRNGQLSAPVGFLGGGFGSRGGGGTVETYGFGIRVIHSGVWGFASSPVVTPEEIKRVAGVATDVARASAIAKKTDVRLAPVEKYDAFWEMPIEKDPWSVALEEKVDHLRSVTAAIQKTPGVLFANATAGFEDEWKFLATSEGSIIEQVFHFANCSAAATARQANRSRRATTSAWRAPATSSSPNAICLGRPTVSRPKPSNIRKPNRWGRGSRIWCSMPSHLALTIHEIVRTRPSSIVSPATRPTTRAPAS